MEKDKPIEIVLGNKIVAEAGSQQVNITQNNFDPTKLEEVLKGLSGLKGSKSDNSDNCNNSDNPSAEAKVPQPSTKSPQPSKAPKPSKKKKEAARILEDVFTYKWKDAPQGVMRVIELYKRLTKGVHPRLDPQTKHEDWEALFMGDPKPFMMKWMGSQQDLYYMVTIWLNEGLITKDDAIGQWEIVGSHILNSKGRPFTTDWNKVKKPKRAARVVELLAAILDPTKPLPNEEEEHYFQHGEYEDIPEEESSIIKGATKYSRKKSEEDW